MGEQIKEKEAIGARYIKDFEIGDLVSWCRLACPIGSKEYGYIIQIYNDSVARGRSFTFAKVRKTNGSIENFMLAEIKKES
jgi:hypothetical protein|tara:strand:+ start:1401 stop:1643 length:243 start_codon:yes stop_codon:yes gene_type:complete